MTPEERINYLRCLNTIKVGDRLEISNPDRNDGLSNIVEVVARGPFAGSSKASLLLGLLGPELILNDNIGAIVMASQTKNPFHFVSWEMLLNPRLLTPTTKSQYPWFKTLNYNLKVHRIIHAPR